MHKSRQSIVGRALGLVASVDLQDVEGKRNCDKKDILEWKSTWDGWG